MFKYVCSVYVGLGLYIINVVQMELCVARTYLCVRVFVVKTEGKRMVKTYLHICMCVYVHVKTKIVTKYLPSLWLNLWGNVEVHEKFINLKMANILISIWLWTYFRWLYILLFLTVVLQSSCLELWQAGRAESRRKWKMLSKAWNILVSKSHDQLQTQDLFFCGTSSFGIPNAWT